MTNNHINSEKSCEFRLCQEILRCYGEKCETTKIETFINQPKIKETLVNHSNKVLQYWKEWQKKHELVSLKKANDSTDNSQSLNQDNPLQASANTKTSTGNKDSKPASVVPAKTETPSRHHTASSAKEIKRGQSLTQAPSKTVPKPMQHVSQVRFKLPNATIGKDYEEMLNIESGINVEVSHIEGLDELALRYIEPEKRVQGNPSKAGEYPISVYYHFSDSKYQKTPQQQTINFVINNDPKALWKNIPSDQNMTFWKPDEDKQEREGQDGWKLVGASKRGRSHAHEGTCRDDDFLITSKANKWHILAVSDGAGSSQYAREGARIAVKQSTEILSSKLDEYNDDISRLILEWNNNRNSDKNTRAVQQILYKVFSQAIYESIKGIHNTAKENGCEYRDLYATLLIAAHKVVAGKHLVIAYWIGDGALALYKEKEYINLLGENDSGEYAGQTRFLDSKAIEDQDIIRRIRFDCQDSMTALFLMTDGITDPIFDTDDNLRLQKYWDQFWGKVQSKLSEKPNESAQNLLEWLDFWYPGNHDDRTLALIYHPESLSYE